MHKPGVARNLEPLVVCLRLVLVSMHHVAALPELRVVGRLRRALSRGSSALGPLRPTVGGWDRHFAAFARPMTTEVMPL